MPSIVRLQAFISWHLIVAYIWIQSLLLLTKIQLKRCAPIRIILSYLDHLGINPFAMDRKRLLMKFMGVVTQHRISRGH